MLTQIRINFGTKVTSLCPRDWSSPALGEISISLSFRGGDRGNCGRPEYRGGEQLLEHTLFLRTYTFIHEMKSYQAVPFVEAPTLYLPM